MSEDREAAFNKKMVPNKERTQTANRPNKGLTPIVSVTGWESSSSSSMEQLLQEVRAFVVRSAPGTADAVA